MRRLLPLLFAAVAAALPLPAGGQYVYFDSNSDQKCDGLDLPWGTDVPIDVYLDTNHDASGAIVTCPMGEPLSMGSYELVFRASSYRGSTWSFGEWTNAVTGYTEIGRAASGDELWVGYGGAFLPPGRYKLGTLLFTSEPCTSLYLATVMTGTAHFTGFGSECAGSSQDFTLRLGSDFFDSCGLGYCDETRSSTWGAIKTRYR